MTQKKEGGEKKSKQSAGGTFAPPAQAPEVGNPWNLPVETGEAARIAKCVASQV